MEPTLQEIKNCLDPSSDKRDMTVILRCTTTMFDRTDCRNNNLMVTFDKEI